MSDFTNSQLYDEFMDILPTLKNYQVKEMNELYQRGDMEELYWYMNFLSSVTNNDGTSIEITDNNGPAEKIEVKVND